ncbi:Hypothetical predicted protein [Marmota monax]|uniref:Uncharacterized protein n=1 Tax=Marmota monax TaxID=9995 RepID=A0A5E4BZ77_MARMO|nr:Hypothetical predicted protein [Marmota monax]
MSQVSETPDRLKSTLTQEFRVRTPSHTVFRVKTDAPSVDPTSDPTRVPKQEPGYDDTNPRTGHRKI